MSPASVLDRYPTPACANTLGFQLLETDMEEGLVRVGFEASPAFCNPSGAVQGGFLAAMLDDTMGPIILIASDGADYPVTISMTVSYLAAARPGPMMGEGRLLQRGKSIAFAAAELFDSRGVLVATATSSLRIVPAEKALA